MPDSDAAAGSDIAPLHTVTVPTISTPEDPYQLHPADVTEPPSSILGILRRIGPGMILAASIVGSGELIATTTLGAQVGYAALWVILLTHVTQSRSP